MSCDFGAYDGYGTCPETSTQTQTVGRAVCTVYVRCSVRYHVLRTRIQDVDRRSAKERRTRARVPIKNRTVTY